MSVSARVGVVLMIVRTSNVSEIGLRGVIRRGTAPLSLIVKQRTDGLRANIHDTVLMAVIGYEYWPQQPTM